MSRTAPRQCGPFWAIRPDGLCAIPSIFPRCRRFPCPNYKEVFARVLRRAIRGPPHALRREALDRPPTVSAATVAQPIVQPVVALLPELEALGSEPEAAPVARERQLAGRRRASLSSATRPRAPRGSSTIWLCGEASALSWLPARAAAHVVGRLLGAHALDRPLDPHLPAERIPVEEQRGARVGCELATLAARRSCV